MVTYKHVHTANSGAQWREAEPLSTRTTSGTPGTPSNNGTTSLQNDSITQDRQWHVLKVNTPLGQQAVIDSQNAQKKGLLIHLETHARTHTHTHTHGNVPHGFHYSTLTTQPYFHYGQIPANTNGYIPTYGITGV